MIIIEKLQQIVGIVENQSRLMDELLEDNSYVKESLIGRNNVVKDKIEDVIEELRKL